MRHLSILIGALASLLMATAVNATEPLDSVQDFQRLCVANQAKPAAVLAQADAEGWKGGPTDFPGIPKMTGVAVRIDPGGHQIVLVVGQASFPDQNLIVQADACFIAVKTTAPADIHAAVASWIGIARDPGESHDGVDAYAYLDTDKGRQVIVNPNDDKAKSLVRSGKVRFLLVQDENDAVLIALLTLKM